MGQRKVCSVLTCPNKTPTTDTNVKFFTFPRTDDLREKWFQHVNNTSLVHLPYNHIKNKYFICERHFEDFYFQTPEKKKLNRNAMPTLHLQQTETNAATERILDIITDKSVPSVTESNKSNFEQLGRTVFQGRLNETSAQQAPVKKQSVDGFRVTETISRTPKHAIIRRPVVLGYHVVCPTDDATEMPARYDAARSLFEEHCPAGANVVDIAGIRKTSKLKCAWEVKYVRRDGFDDISFEEFARQIRCAKPNNTSVVKQYKQYPSILRIILSIDCCC